MLTIEINHPDHAVPDEVAEGLRLLREQEAHAAAQHFELAKLTRPAVQERLSSATVYQKFGNALSVDVDEYRAQMMARNEAAVSRLEGADFLAPRPHFEFVPLDFEPPPPGPADPTFWAARSEIFHTPPFDARVLADGFHFSGKLTSDSGSLQFLTYGAASWYELHADRVPPSTFSRWSSSPHVELSGQLWAYTGEGDIFAGDCWSKCWVTRRQTLVQHIFGGTTKIGEAIDVQTIFDEANTNRPLIHYLPGSQPIPPVILNGIFGGVSIWAEVEVRFDIQLEGTAFHWIHPSDVLLRGFQWPLIPL